jgi:hypothetical protein
MRLFYLGTLAGVLTLLLSCSTTKAPDPAALEAAAAARIQAIPAADPAQSQKIKDMKEWRNPYLILRTNGVALLDAGNHEEHMLKPEELLTTLANLPGSAWPYGRVVALQDEAIPDTDPDEKKVQIRRNRGIVAGTLEEAHVLIRWVPAA